MQREQLIPATEFCTRYGVEYAFVASLQEAGLVQLVTEEEQGYIPLEELQQIEKYMRLHYDLDINMQGIEAITHLLNRVQQMQQQITTLTSRLQLYEEV
jgi:hypothetical protein